MNKKIAELDAEVAKRASKKLLSKKVADLQKKLADESISAGDEASKLQKKQLLELHCLQAAE